MTSKTAGHYETLIKYGQIGHIVTAEQCRLLISAAKGFFMFYCSAWLKAHVASETLPFKVPKDVTDVGRWLDTQLVRIATKFNDAGRRSPPWKKASSRVPGIPQDGADGNRIRRWHLDPGHKFYAAEIEATLVEIKYYLQTFSLTGAPELPDTRLTGAYRWLIEHPVEPGAFLDPIQLIEIRFSDFLIDARVLQSGHLIPLDRGGRHEPKNAFLMLHRSNQLQGNLKLDELVELMGNIVERHRQKRELIRQAKALSQK